MPRPSAAVAAGGFNVTARIKGARASAANIRAMDKAVRRAFFEALVEIADKILKHSQDTYVPVLTGELKRSGKVMPHPGRYPSVEIGFGGGAVDYARIQHENMEFQHPRGGSAKYLELAVKDYESEIEDRTGQAVSAKTRLYDMRGKVR